MTIARWTNFIPQPLRFTFVGGCAAVIHFMTVFFLVETFSLAPLLSNVFAFLIAFSVSFSGQRFFTFAHSSVSLKSSFIKFFTIALIAFLLNEVLFFLLLSLFQMNYQLALVIVLLIVAIGTYFSSKHWASSK